MLYAKIKNNEVVKYPYSFTNLQEENPYTSYPTADIEHWFPLTEEAQMGYEIVSVNYTAHPLYNAITQRIQEINPIKTNGQWQQAWQVLDYSEEEITNNELKAKQDNKNTAETLLQESDWVEYPSVADVSKNPHLTNLNEWIDYRVALRAIAINPPITVEQWPVKPQEVWSS